MKTKERLSIIINRKKFYRPFYAAYYGIKNVYQNQFHFKVQITFSLLVLSASAYYRLPLTHTLFIVMACFFVLISEMMNTCIEMIVNLVSPEYHPLAKISKDIGAGAVLLSAVLSVVIGVAVLLDIMYTVGVPDVLSLEETYPHFIARGACGFLLVLFMTIVGKNFGGSGLVTKGGLISGHASIAFYVATTISLLYMHSWISMACFFLAGMVVQSRVEGGIHTIIEIFYGGVLGALVSIMLFGLK